MVEASSNAADIQQQSLMSQIGQPWIQALLYFKFDLEIGAVLETCYPQDCLSQSEERELCTLAFPEVQTSHEITPQQKSKQNSSIGDSDVEVMNYTFRLRQKCPNVDYQQKKQNSLVMQDQSLRYMSANIFNFNYCYTLFRKRRDPKSKRGWSQESFVLISELNLVSLFYRLSELVSTPNPSQDLLSVFESLYQQSLNVWPWPTPASTVRVIVSLKGLEPVALDVQLPESMLRGLHPNQLAARAKICQIYTSKKQQSELQQPSNQQETAGDLKSNSEEQRLEQQATINQNIKQQLMKQFFDNSIRGIGNELKVQEAFQGNLLLLLWNIWELIITEQPLLVVGSDPRECSHAILTALSILHPLTSFADVRPYLTIQNCDTEVYYEMIKEGIVPNAIIGISSPLLTKNFASFPAILRLDNNFCKESKLDNPKNIQLKSEGTATLKKTLKETKQFLQVKNKKSLVLKPQPFVLDHLEFTSEDKITINDFNTRSHFKHMTKTFLDSFESYWQCDVTYPTLLKPFLEKEFIKQIDKNNRFCRQFLHGKLDKTRQLYRSFVQTSIFRHYHQTRREEALKKFLS